MHNVPVETEAERKLRLLSEKLRTALGGVARGLTRPFSRGFSMGDTPAAAPVARGFSQGPGSLRRALAAKMAEERARQNRIDFPSQQLRVPSVGVDSPRVDRTAASFREPGRNRFTRIAEGAFRGVTGAVGNLMGRAAEITEPSFGKLLAPVVDPTLEVADEGIRRAGVEAAKHALGVKTGVEAIQGLPSSREALDEREQELIAAFKKKRFRDPSFGEETTLKQEAFGDVAPGTWGAIEAIVAFVVPPFGALPVEKTALQVARALAKGAPGAARATARGAGQAGRTVARETTEVLASEAGAVGREGGEQAVRVADDILKQFERTTKALQSRRGQEARALESFPDDPQHLALRGESEALLAERNAGGDILMASQDVKASRTFYDEFAGSFGADERAVRASVERAEAVLAEVQRRLATTGRAGGADIAERLALIEAERVAAQERIARAGSVDELREIATGGQQAAREAADLPSFDDLRPQLGEEAIAARGMETVEDVAAELPILTGKQSLPPQPPDDILGRVQRMWEEPPKRPADAGKRRSARLAFEERMNDRFVRGNDAAGQARREWKATTGDDLPTALDFELQAALNSGADGIGLQWYNDAARAAARILRDIPSYEVDTYLHLQHAIEIVKAKGPQRKIAGGLSIDDAEQGLELLATRLGPEQMARVRDAAKAFDDQVNTVLNLEVGSGLITQETATGLRELYPHYFPLRYHELLESTMEGLGPRSFSVTGSGLRRLSAEGLENEIQRPTSALVGHFLRSARRVRRNEAAKALVHDLLLDPNYKGKIKKVSGVRPVATVDDTPIFRRPPGEQRGTVSFMENGQRVMYEVPPEIERMAKGLFEQPYRDASGLLRAIQMPFRAGFVTYNPAFMVAQSMFDTVTVAATRGVMPWDVATSMLRNLRAIFQHDEEMARIMRAGGSVIGWHGRIPAQVVRLAEKKGQLVIANQMQWQELFTKPWETLRNIGLAMEMAPRRAAFRKGVREGLSDEEAALVFKRSTVDFQRVGSSMALANQWFLFLNPAWQGTLLPFRALRDSPVAKYGLAGLVGLSSSTYAWNRQFPEYQDIPLFDKYDGVLLMLPSDEFDVRGNKVPHYIKIVPMLRELSAFTAPFLYAMQKLDDVDPESVTRFLGQMADTLNPFGMIAGSSYPVPTQIGATLTEIAVNRDPFRDRDIVPLELVNKPAREQFDTFTSEVAKRVGDFLNFSPKKIDHLLRQGVWNELFALADQAILKVDPRDQYIGGLVEQLRSIQETVPPDQIPAERRRFLAALESEVRDEVMEQARAPQPRIPFVESIQRRFNRRFGGNLYRSGQEAAKAATGISPEQTRQVSILLGSVYDDLTATQVEQDRALENGTITHVQWRSAHKTSGTLYQGALVGLKSIFPAAGQIAAPDDFAAYQKYVATVADAMPDRRTRGDIIYAAWRSIPVPEIVEGIENWPAFFELQDAFMENLTVGDRALIQERRETYMTPQEREWQGVKEALRPYWGIGDDFQLQTPTDQDTWEEYRRADRLHKADLVQRNSWLNHWIRTEREERIKFRQDNPSVDALLITWDYATTPSSDEGTEARRQALGEPPAPTERRSIEIQPRQPAAPRRSIGIIKRQDAA